MKEWNIRLVELSDIAIIKNHVWSSPPAYNDGWWKDGAAVVYEMLFSIDRKHGKWGFQLSRPHADKWLASSFVLPGRAHPARSLENQHHVSDTLEKAIDWIDGMLKSCQSKCGDHKVERKRRESVCDEIVNGLFPSDEWKVLVSSRKRHEYYIALKHGSGVRHIDMKIGMTNDGRIADFDFSLHNVPTDGRIVEHMREIVKYMELRDKMGEA